MLRILVSLVLSVGLFAALGSVERTAAPAADDPPEQLIATFSIAAVDPESGVCGAAVASKYPAVGKVVAHARADVGRLLHPALRPQGLGRARAGPARQGQDLRGGVR